MKTKPYAIRYRWTKRGKTYTGHTVASGTSQADARARFARENPHVQLIP